MNTETSNENDAGAADGAHKGISERNARAQALYAAPGGPLMGWLCNEAVRRSHDMQAMAKALEVTYGYISQLRNGLRSTESISQEFAASCAK